MGGKTRKCSGSGNFKGEVLFNSREDRRAKARQKAKEEKRNGKGSIRHRN